MISTLLPHSVSAAKWLAALVAVVFLMVAGHYVGDRFEPDRAPAPPDTVTKERTITRTDTVTETVPRTVIRYKRDTVRATDTLRVPVPTGFEMMGVLPRRPLDLSDSEATLTYWTGDRWQQNVYDLPDEPWALWPAVEIRTTPIGLEATGTLSLRYRKVTLSAGYTTIAGERGFTAGIAVRPFTLTW